jgi:hypothetical protein
MAMMRVTVVLSAFLVSAAAPVRLEPWAPAGVSTDQFESHAAFDPRTGDLYFVRSRPDFTGWRILTSRCGPTGWTSPEPPPFAGDGLEADPWFTPDGRSLYFISNRTTDGVKRADLDIWRLDRDAGGRWGTPVRLPAPVNSSAYEWFPRLSADGWLYFGSGRPGGLGKTDIWRARQDAAGAWQVENLGPPVNSAKNEYEALPSPDGRRLIVEGDDGYFEVEKTAAGWGPRRPLPPEVNVNGSEIGLAASPSGRTLMFARDTKGPKSGEFFVWRRGGSERWPPPCPKR